MVRWVEASDRVELRLMPGKRNSTLLHTAVTWRRARIPLVSWFLKFKTLPTFASCAFLASFVFLLHDCTEGTWKWRTLLVSFCERCCSFSLTLPCELCKVHSLIGLPLRTKMHGAYSHVRHSSSLSVLYSLVVAPVVKIKTTYYFLELQAILFRSCTFIFVEPKCIVSSVSAWIWYWEMLCWWFLGYH